MPRSENSLPSPAWGKLGTDGSSQDLRDHCRDVAAIFVALCRLPGIRTRLSRLADVDQLSDISIERLGWFVFLHDLGKVNAGFQARRFPGAPMVGHVAPILGLYDDICALVAKGLDNWGDDAQLSDLFHAVLSHHGKPWAEDPTNPDQNLVLGYRRHWRPDGAYDPCRELYRLRRAADLQFPAAFDASAPTPLASPLIHAVAGLAMLADWIASSDWQNSPPADRLSAWAEAWLVRIGLDAIPWRTRLPEELDFRATFGFAPTLAQAAFASAPGALAILESETGSGKTEAALWRFVMRLRAGAVDGLYFALPTRTAAAQLHGRVERLVRALWPDGPPAVVLAVPGYLDDSGAGGLPDARDAQDETEGDARQPPTWAHQHPKRYFTGLIGVGTIDQALMSVLKVKHAEMRGAALMRLMLVIDEVHASDAYMSALTEELLSDHLAAGGEAALLSATLSARMRVRYASIGHAAHGNLRAAETVLPDLEAATRLPYPAITANTRLGGEVIGIAASGREKRVALEVASLIDDAEAVAERAALSAAEGAKVLVIRNTVSAAIATQQALERRLGPASPLLFRVEGVPTLHHGRFAREDRLLLDRAVEVAVGKARPPGGRVIVGTQTLEQSLDIDADYLISDLCPIDVLLQRLGRLHRHASEPDGERRKRPAIFLDPNALVLVPPGDLGDLLSGRRRGVDSHGLGPMKDKRGGARGIYPDVVVLELTRRLLIGRPLWTIPADNRDLVERALHPEAREALVESVPDEIRDLWRQHWSELEGGAFADGGTARGACLRRDKPFMDHCNWIDPEERAATRLGDAGPMIDLPEGTIGPFGKTVRRLVIPHWWHADVAETSLMRVDNGEIQFELGETQVLYGRHGLLRREA
ncbi:CRISPR-associated helicase Cas3' [Pleomorphomonas sp. NRK KF1]|uniref:CRISPR-associated helicase Cas3' n=1 Tax=Pleomorphomonas sp. NRK KF1 TaxID=2943000 RepID=UPI0020446F82|nr:CRISPR-associated helicase Cas3' [Pleomorphomonas sp. NRK KF1]MCM5552389.1 CRISPR-associated helicase Cas3' [Pleomorphomonas sp. NRK KF1]